MTAKSLDTELGGLYTPAFVASKRWLPTTDPIKVREMCATGELTHTVTYGKNGQARYYISDNDIRAWRKKHQQR